MEGCIAHYQQALHQSLLFWNELDTAIREASCLCNAIISLMAGGEISDELMQRMKILMFLQVCADSIHLPFLKAIFHFHVLNGDSHIGG